MHIIPRMTANLSVIDPRIRSARHKVELPVFSGPMELLLQLIERDELDISSVSLAAVTDQYLVHMRHVKEKQLDNLTEFMVMAARLILIKSQSLLPRPHDKSSDEEDPGEDLARQLLLYKAFKGTAQHLDRRQVNGIRTYVRLVRPERPVPELDLAGKNTTDIWEGARRVLGLGASDPTRVSEILAAPVVTVREKIDVIVVALRLGPMVRFFDFLRRGQPRSEVVMTFLAILELVKMGLVLARQQSPFGDIEIARQGEGVDKYSKDFDSELD